MMKLYFCNSRTVDATYIIRAENEWQARDIADNLFASRTTRLAMARFRN